jgi:curli biogenesis system outer membrane secretion channel CsgG
MKKLFAALTIFAALAACSASETDFKKAAEELAVETAEENNPGFTATAKCDDPSSTDVDTTFSCTVTFNDGDTAQLVAKIVSDDTVSISSE